MVKQAGCATTLDAEVHGTVGVDTHRDLHVAVALNQHGGWLGTRAFPTTPSGFAALTTWATRYGILGAIGIEGTGSYGAGLARWLRARGLTVVEIERPDRRDRQGRRRRGKSDPTDAEAAARAVLAGTAIGQPKAADGRVEMIRVLANRALYLLVLGRMSWDPRTRDYVARRTAEGLSKPEIIRCLKRYLAREVYRLLRAPTDVRTPDFRA